MVWVLCTLLPQNKHPFSTVFLLAALFAIGLSPYAYIVIAMQRSPKPGSWGDVTTLKGFFHHLRRADYGSFQLYSGGKKDEAEPMLERIQIYAQDVWERQGLKGFVPVAAVIGIIFLLFKRGQEEPQHSPDRHKANNHKDKRPSNTKKSTKKGETHSESMTTLQMRSF